MTAQPLLELHGVSKRFGAIQALDKVDFAVRAGEVMALVGDNGAGKSTLIKGVAGDFPFDEGEIVFNGRAVTIQSPRDSFDLGIEVLYQDLSLIDNLDVVANMFLGRETMHRLWPILNEEDMENECVHTLQALAVTTVPSVRQRIANLSGGQRQAVAVARALMWNSKLVILDEPTAALGVVQTQQLLDLVKKLAQKGLAVVFISHNLNDVFSVADRITVLRLGKRVAVYTAVNTTQEEVIHTITAGVTPL
jgi:D-xylose transport system ATP-binding protein